MHKKYRVTLTLAEREELERMLARGKADVRKIKHAQILLKADEADEAESGPAWPDVYRPRLVRHRLACYAASTAVESWFCRTAAGVWNPCRSMSQVVL